jgi:hypothetical protein
MMGKMPLYKQWLYGRKGNGMPALILILKQISTPADIPEGNAG